MAVPTPSPLPTSTMRARTELVPKSRPSANLAILMSVNLRLPAIAGCCQHLLYSGPIQWQLQKEGQPHLWQPPKGQHLPSKPAHRGTVPEGDCPSVGLPQRGLSLLDYLKYNI